MSESVITPRGLSRAQAAGYVGIGTTLFDRLVVNGKMPSPREIEGRIVWDRHELDEAFAELPRRGVEIATGSSDNPWDKRLGAN